MLECEPLTERCGGLLSEATHVCIGVSPFNSYFSTPRLRRLAGWALRRFGNVHFFVPDAVAAYTLEALGYEPDRARHKARRQGQYVHNKIATALHTLGVANPDRHVLGMDRLYGTPRYLTLLDEAYRCFQEDEDFRTACLGASHWVLERNLPPGATPGEEQLHSAARYFLAELPLFADAGGITGHRPSLFVYHQRVAFLERFYRRELSWRPTDGQGFLVVREPVEQRSAAEPAQGPVQPREVARDAG
ncbi:cyclo(L-leucyl-L-leucyl) synthase [Streptomyces virens]|jgi:cyclo(L-tyrosyl-L-tyrosyl) synthase|uniref:Cyclodipeptide synthase n=2 Tax=Streptomyces TaxID=1883 RepID=A0AA40SGE9_9ACTN|nr:MULTISPECIES: tRNA-dependent cyclodipeptide synthase [Streptomyces]MBA8945676.1 cyclo(L-tyrosyl-L-tyrosyl) synthase [Streptomyces calvus]MYS30407.1 tRNA-dependent cyclodipeptide synthase [Streptomyces sp. SID7804]GGP42748.1 cyclo(L-leucyl-L-leucyl) synthase [Streptomyces calvus]